MSTGAVNVRYEQVRQIYRGLRTEATAFSSHLAQVRSIVNELVDDGFVTDEASDAFRERVDGFATNAGTSVTALNNYASFLSKAAEAFENADKALSRELGSEGSTPTLEIDLPELRELRGNLRAAASDFDKGRNASACLSSEAYGHEDIAGAMEDFDKGWAIRRGQIVKAITALGEAYESIDSTFTTLDTELTGKLSGEDD